MIGTGSPAAGAAIDFEGLALRSGRQPNPGFSAPPDREAAGRFGAVLARVADQPNPAPAPARPESSPSAEASADATGDPGPSAPQAGSQDWANLLAGLTDQSSAAALGSPEASRGRPNPATPATPLADVAGAAGDPEAASAQPDPRDLASLLAGMAPSASLSRDPTAALASARLGSTARASPPASPPDGAPVSGEGTASAPAATPPFGEEATQSLAALLADMADRSSGTTPSGAGPTAALGTGRPGEARGTASGRIAAAIPAGASVRAAAALAPPASSPSSTQLQAPPSPPPGASVPLGTAVTATGGAFAMASRLGLPPGGPATADGLSGSDPAGSGKTGPATGTAGHGPLASRGKTGLAVSAGANPADTTNTLANGLAAAGLAPAGTTISPAAANAAATAAPDGSAKTMPMAAPSSRWGKPAGTNGIGSSRTDGSATSRVAANTPASTGTATTGTATTGTATTGTATTGTAPTGAAPTGAAAASVMPAAGAEGDVTAPMSSGATASGFGSAGVGTVGARSNLSAPPEASAIASAGRSRGAGSNGTAPPASAAPLSMAVVDRQTHLGLAPTLSPMQQIADVVKSVANQAAGPTGAETAVSSALSRAATAGRQSTQNLTIRLEPEHLGTVVVRMRMSADALELQVEASNPQTADLLLKDKALLSESLGSSNTKVEVTSVGTGTSAGSEPQSAGSNARDAGSNPQSAGSNAQGRHHDPQAQSQGRIADRDFGGADAGAGSAGRGGGRSTPAQRPDRSSSLSGETASASPVEPRRATRSGGVFV